jgi:hypothetical protein
MRDMEEDAFEDKRKKERKKEEKDFRVSKSLYFQ